ncbi:MAG: glyoxalase [Gemmatimonadetes bacterium]|nr:glyoxalase [Gemmatimonadota bacterium]|tara:strand:+ start:765 stop:1184 length:420 start_codon:yes stop_codon:yes gene_type:complete
MAGNNAAIGGGGFHHVAIRAYDFDASVKFYTEVLGFTEKIAWGEDRGRAVMLDTGDGNYLEIFANGEEGSKPEGAIIHFALRTNDVDGVIAKARSAGCEVTVEPKDLTIQSRPAPTPLRLAFFKGPDGEIIELLDNETT